MEYSLKKERDKFLQESHNICTTEDEEILVKSVFIFVENQDKEFVKKVKEQVCMDRHEDCRINMCNTMLEKNSVQCSSCRRIDNLAGYKFVKRGKDAY